MFLCYRKSGLLLLFPTIKLILFLNPKGDQHSPENTYSLSREKVMGMYQMVTKKGFDLLSNLLD